MFSKENSVFKEWKLDNQALLKRCLDSDSFHWKVHKDMIKDKQLYKELLEIIGKNYGIIKN